MHNCIVEVTIDQLYITYMGLGYTGAYIDG